MRRTWLAIGLTTAGMVGVMGVVGVALAQQFPAPVPDRPLRPGIPTPNEATKTAPVNAGEFLVSIEGAKQGRFKGEGNKDQTRDKIVGLFYQHEMAAKRDADGKPEGRARHEVLTITKGVGAASPQILQAAASGEVLKTVVIEMYQGGTAEAFYTVTLSNARIVSLKQFNEKGWYYETVGLSFEKMEVEHRGSKSKAVDDGR